MFLSTEANSEREGSGEWASSLPNRQGSLGKRRKLPQRPPPNFLNFGASRTPLPRLESSYWRFFYSRSGNTVADTEQFAGCSNVAVINRVSKHYTRSKLAKYTLYLSLRQAMQRQKVLGQKYTLAPVP